MSRLESLLTGRHLSRRSVVFGLASLAATALVGCDESETTKVVESNTIDLKNTPLIPNEFANKPVTKLLSEEILPRLGVAIDRIGQGPQPYVNTTLENDGETISIKYYKHGIYESAEFTVTRKSTSNRYFYEFGSTNRTVVLTGETATKKEAEEIRKNMRQTLHTAFNNCIKQGKQIQVTTARSIRVEKNPTSTPRTQ